MLSFSVSDIYITPDFRPFLVFFNIKIIWISCEFFIYFFRFYIVILTSAVYYEATCMFDLAKGTILATILNNTANSVSK